MLQSPERVIVYDILRSVPSYSIVPIPEPPINAPAALRPGEACGGDVRGLGPGFTRCEDPTQV